MATVSLGVRFAAQEALKGRFQATEAVQIVYLIGICAVINDVLDEEMFKLTA